MLTKEKIIEQISLLPYEVAIDDLIERLVFIDKLQSRLDSSVNEEVISDEQLGKEMESWFISIG